MNDKDRRNCNRLNVSLLFSWQPLTTELEEGMLLTLSATGVSFPAAEALDAGTKVLLTFFLPYAAQMVRVRALILRSTIRESRNPKQACLIAAQFVDPGQEMEDEIARFIIVSESKQLRQTHRHHEENT